MIFEPLFRRRPFRQVGDIPRRLLLGQFRQKLLFQHPACRQVGANRLQPTGGQRREVWSGWAWWCCLHHDRRPVRGLLSANSVRHNGEHFLALWARRVHHFREVIDGPFFKGARPAALRASEDSRFPVVAILEMLCHIVQSTNTHLHHAPAACAPATPRRGERSAPVKRHQGKRGIREQHHEVTRKSCAKGNGYYYLRRATMSNQALVVLNQGGESKEAVGRLFHIEGHP